MSVHREHVFTYYTLYASTRYSELDMLHMRGVLHNMYAHIESSLTLADNMMSFLPSHSV